MLVHRNAKLGLAGRFALVQAIGGGMSLKAAAAAFNVSPATAHRWWHRWLDAGEEARETLSCLFDRSSRPHHSPRQLASEFAEAICRCRQATGWGPRLVGGATGFPHSTVWKVLKCATGSPRGARAGRLPRWSRSGSRLRRTTRHLLGSGGRRPSPRLRARLLLRPTPRRRRSRTRPARPRSRPSPSLRPR